MLANGSGFGTLSDPSINVEYQSQRLVNGFYPTSAGNFAFFTENVLFLGINQVGGGPVGDESTRVANNYNWVESNMATFSSQGMRAVVIFAHASMGAARNTHFGNPFKSLLRDQYADTKVLYIHGDGHDFHTYQPDGRNSNLMSLEVNAGEESDPLLISVTHDVVADDFSFQLDVRSGYYFSGCQAGNVDKTWSSNY